MTTSFTRTREQLRSMVLRKLGVLGSSTSVVSADADIVYEAIDLRLKELHQMGVFWRKVSTVPVQFSLTAGINSAHVATNDILFPLALTVVDYSLDEPLDIIGPLEYARISDKNYSGLPERVMWKGSTEFVFHPIPTLNTTVKLVYEKLADDTSAGAAPDVEVSMIRWLKDIIAYDVGDDFGVDEQRMARFGKDAIAAEVSIRMLAVERKDYTTVAVDDWPDYRGRRSMDP